MFSNVSYWVFQSYLVHDLVDPYKGRVWSASHRKGNLPADRFLEACIGLVDNGRPNVTQRPLNISTSGH